MERGKMLCCTSAAKVNFVRKLVAFSCSQIRQSLSLPAQLMHDDDNEDISKQRRSISGQVSKPNIL
jgi:hypothetical protein